MVAVCPDVPDHARLSAKEVCILLDVSFNTLKARVADGRITPSFFADGRPFYWGKDVKALWRKW